MTMFRQNMKEEQKETASDTEEEGDELNMKEE
jgi:hypothetical protein